MLLALNAVWRDVDTPAVNGGPGGRRLVVVDEAWSLLRDGEGARFLYRLAKAARKRRAGVAVVTPDAGGPVEQVPEGAGHPRRQPRSQLPGGRVGVVVEGGGEVAQQRRRPAPAGRVVLMPAAW